MTPEESKVFLQRPYPMLLVHPKRGSRVSWDMFEQNRLMSEGWREAKDAADDLRKNGRA